MQKFNLSHAQAKRSIALKKDNMRDYWLYDAMICLHLGLDKLALDSLALATKKGK